MRDKETNQKPNILMIMVDQMRFPRFCYGEDGGFVDPLKRILGFQDQAHDSNEFKKFFPGLSALTNNAVVLNNHKTASAACVPSRTALFTGQYGTKTGAVQTDGVFKDGSSKKFPWLESSDYPTLGHWMKKSGYSTHYFGKWHISGEDTKDLEEYGFSDWELSCPDPHGTLPNNLGYYRDYQFEDVVTAFLRRQGLGIPFSVAHAEANCTLRKNDEPVEGSPTPWFAVSSFTNPHDIGAYPGIPSTVCNERVEGAHYTLAVPPKGIKGALPKDGTMEIVLNKLGFPQNNANVAPTWNEELIEKDGKKANKPDCQFDYRYKMGLALSSKAGRLAAEKAAKVKEMDYNAQLDFAVNVALNANVTGLPFALTENTELSSRAFMQYYGYMMHEVDQHINEVLKTLDETGQADNTIVLFCADHGEYGASHGAMMEKWHSAYEEMLHVPMVIRFPQSLHQVPGGLKQISELTSHIDLLPTILGLAGVSDNEALAEIQEKLEGFTNKPMPIGANLTSLILGEETSVIKDREGVLFITHDTITEGFDGKEDTNDNDKDKKIIEKELTQMDVYEEAVKRLRENSDGKYPEEVEKLKESSVCTPNLVHCVVSKDNWKLVRYFELSETEGDYRKNNQFELYDLNTDPMETNNLVVYDEPEVTPISHKNKKKAEEMEKLLIRLEEKML